MAEFSPLAESIYSGNGMGQHYTNPEHVVVQKAVSLVKETEAKSVLDLACGRGIVSLALGRWTNATSIDALDINEPGVVELNKHAALENLPIQAVVFDAADEKGYKEIVPEGSVDVVIAKDLYPFLSPQKGRAMFGNIEEALKPGGWLLITAPSTRSRLYQEAEATHTPLYRKLGQEAKDFVQTDLDYFTFTTISNMAELMAQHGMEMTEAIHYGRAKGWIMALGQKNS